VKTTEEDTGDDEVAATIDGVEDGGEGGATGGIGKDVVAGHFQLTLDVAGRHQSGGDTGSVVREDVLVTTMRISWKLKIAVADGTMDVAISGTKDDIATLLGIVATVGMEEFELVGGGGLGTIVEMGAYFQRVRLGARRGGVGRDGAAGADLADVVVLDFDHFGGNGVGIGIDLDGGE
jgi:hypothetical protein